MIKWTLIVFVYIAATAPALYDAIHRRPKHDGLCLYTYMTWPIYLSCMQSSHAVVDNRVSKMGTPESASTIQTHMTLNRGYGQYVEMTGTREIWYLVFNTSAPIGFCRLYRLHNDKNVIRGSENKKKYQKLNTSAHSSTKYNFSKRGGRGTNFPPKSWQTEKCTENELHRQTSVFQGLYNISTVSTCISLISFLIFFLILTVRALIRLLKMCRPKKMGGGGVYGSHFSTFPRVLRSRG